MKTGHSEVRPSLRGVSHAIAVVGSVAGAIALWKVCAGDRAKQISMLVFGCALIGLYSTSATYHLGSWKGRVYRVFRRLDRVMIFFLIAGTYTPFCFNLLEGSTRTVMLALVWGAALLGAAVKVFMPFVPRWIGVPIYLAVGWLAIIQAEAFWNAMGGGGIMLVAAGGLAYTVGAIIYALKSPNPFPATFGYHEVFHLLVISGSLTHFLALFYFVAPLPRV